MKLIILAFIISISLHLLIFNDYELTKKQDVQEKNVKKENKAKVTFAKIKKEKKVIKKIVKKEVIKKPKIEKPKIIKTKEIKKIAKKPKKSTKKRPITKKVAKKFIKAPKKIIYDKKRVGKVPSTKKLEAIKNRTLEDFLSQADPVDPKILDDIQKLYGREFETFTKVQKAYIKKNFNSFQVITQRVLTRLGYPQLAIERKLSGNNVVEFIFHPNGDISNLRITNSSGYEVFDKFTLKLIQIAYKDYPKPETSTKLKFNVRYRYY